MDHFFRGMAGAIVLALFFSFAVKIGYNWGSATATDKYLVREEQIVRQNAQQSAQMQCIHWVEQWRSAGQPKGQDGASFGMYTALCGRPSSEK